MVVIPVLTPPVHRLGATRFRISRRPRVPSLSPRTLGPEQKPARRQHPLAPTLRLQIPRHRATIAVLNLLMAIVLLVLPRPRSVYPSDRKARNPLVVPSPLLLSPVQTVYVGEVEFRVHRAQLLLSPGTGVKL